MSNFGRTVGTIDPSKDYLAEAIALSGQNLAQGISAGAQNGVAAYQQGRQAKTQKEQFKAQQTAQKEQTDATREATRTSQMQTELAESTRGIMAHSSGADPATVEATIAAEHQKIMARYRTKSLAPAAAPAPAPFEAATMFQGPTAADNERTTNRMASRFSVMEGSPRESMSPAPGVQAELPQQEQAPPQQQPAAPSMPVPQQAPQLQQGQQPPEEQQPAAPARVLTIPELRASAEANKVAAVEKERQTKMLDTEQSGLSANGWDGFKSKIPGAENLDISKLSQARHARGLLEAYTTQLKLAQGERNARLAAGKDAYQNEGQLRREFAGVAKIYEDRIREAQDVDSLARQANNPADFALMQKFARMMSPGIVTDKEVAQMARPGGLMESYEADYNRLVNKQTLLPEQRARLVAAVKDLESNARANLNNTAREYRGLATSYKFNPDRIVVSEFVSKKAPPGTK